MSGSAADLLTARSSRAAELGKPGGGEEGEGDEVDQGRAEEVADAWALPPAVAQVEVGGERERSGRPPGVQWRPRYAGGAEAANIRCLM